MILSYDMLHGSVTFSGDDFRAEESDRWICLLFGHCRSELGPVAMQVLSAGEETDCAGSFIGPFLLIVYDKLCKSVSIRQHYFGAPVSLYFTAGENCLHLGSSLAAVSKASALSAELNTGMLPHFFYNGFLPGRHTLIKGVSKLPSGHYMQMDRHGIRAGRTAYDFRSDPRVSDEALYERAIPESIRSAALFSEEPFDLALSAGFDSNCILYFIDKLFPGAPKRAFSVGGITGVDETDAARAIAAAYSDTDFYSAMVTPETLDKLDEIVFRLEGAVYERGIFLQYELAKLLSEHGCRRLLCGECADQVFHRDSYRLSDPGVFLYGYADTPYEMASSVVLKKSALMLRSFGIEGCYPFLDTEVLKVGFRTRELNGKDKRFHKDMCLRLLPDSIGKALSKTGGSTSLCAMFPPSFDCLAEARRLKYYSDDLRITQKYDLEEARSDLYLTLRFLESFEKQFCSN